MVEKDFQAKLKKGCPKKFWYYKIPDMPFAEGLRFNVKKPFDVIVIANGKGIAMELKMFKGTAFPFNHIRYHQLTAMRQVVNAGGDALFVIGAEDKLYSLTLDEMSYEASEAEKLGRKSISKERLEHYAIDTIKEFWEMMSLKC